MRIFLSFLDRHFPAIIGFALGFIIGWAACFSVTHRITAAQDTEIPAINFGGGLNVYNAPNDIGDSESPDMANFVNALDGSSFKRNGSQRYISQAYSSSPVTSLYTAYILSVVCLYFILYFIWKKKRR